MSLRKVDDTQWEIKRPCMSQNHNPPGHMVYPLGTFIWRCPACGHETRFST